jgi:hypothetical protein
MDTGSAYVWEKDFEKTWEHLKEDDQGQLIPIPKVPEKKR